MNDPEKYSVKRESASYGYKILQEMETFLDAVLPEEKGVVVGISGGKDSAVVAAVLVNLLGKDRVFGLLMPDGKQKDFEDARTVVESLGIRHTCINIRPIKLAVEEALRIVSPQAAVNIPPRIRMICLYACAQTLGFRVAGTGNASEAYVGYTTKWGDNACDFNLIGNLTTDEVIKLGEYLNVTPGILRKTPHDGLSELTDEAKLGVSYEDINKIIKGKKDAFFSANALLRIEKLHTYGRHKSEPIPVFKPSK